MDLFGLLFIGLICIPLVIVWLSSVAVPSRLS